MTAPPSDSVSGNAKISVVLIAPDDAARRSITKAIATTQARVIRELTEYPGGNVISRLADGCDIIIVDLDADNEAGLEIIETICRHGDAATVMACSARGESDIVIRAMRAGAREFLAAPVAAHAISEAFARALARRQTGAQERTIGKLFVFQGAKGGAGVTTLATNFAVALTQESSGEVVVVDMHPQLGDVALGLGLAPQFSVADALGNAVRLDADFLSTLLARHDSGLRVLASADAYGVHRSLERGAEKLLRILREEFAFVVVDAGSCAGNIPDALFEMADTIYLVTEVSLPALRNARRLISYFSGKESRGLEVILNRFNSRTVEIDEDSAEKALSKGVDWKIPSDYVAVRGSQNTGVPLVNADSAIARTISQMARTAAARCGMLRPKKLGAPAKGEKWKFWTSNSTRQVSTARF